MEALSVTAGVSTARNTNGTANPSGNDGGSCAPPTAPTAVAATNTTHSGTAAPK
jgi:hypothetical protein